MLALLALAWQSLVVHTHVHPPVLTTAGALVRADTVALLAQDAHGNDADTCALCTAAHHGDVALPAVDTPLLHLDRTIELRSVAATPSERRVRSHDWRGRGPPLG